MFFAKIPKFDKKLYVDGIYVVIILNTNAPFAACHQNGVEKNCI